MSGKGSARRRENTALVEAGWCGIDWSATRGKAEDPKVRSADAGPEGAVPAPHVSQAHDWQATTEAKV